MLPPSPIGVLILAWLRLGATPPVSSAPTSAPRPGPLRVIAIGDLHGDLRATRKILRLAGAIDASDRWIGGRLVVVQTGDTLDRGLHDRAVIDLLERLRHEAPESGGRLVVLNGNHEIMNVQGNFGYVSPKAFAAFDDLPIPAAAELWIRRHPLPRAARARLAAFRPGGPYARILAEHPEIVVLEGVVFVHGGLLPRYARDGLDGIDRINAEMSAWLRGEIPAPAITSARDSPWWSRDFSAHPDAEDCARLRRALDLLGARRMVVGHTPVKKGISPACGGLVWRIDCGLSAHYGGPSQALEIRGDAVGVIGERVAASSSPPWIPAAR